MGKLSYTYLHCKPILADFKIQPLKHSNHQMEVKVKQRHNRPNTLKAKHKQEDDDGLMR